MQLDVIAIDLNVYVWGDKQDYAIDYSAGLAVAIARNVREARLLVMEANGAHSIDEITGLDREPDVFPMGKQAHETGGGS